MNIEEQEIERILRVAPGPNPPTDLKDRLLANIRLPSPTSERVVHSARKSQPFWFRQWWPALGSAAVLLGCSVIFAVQQAQIQALQAAIRQLSESAKSNLMAPPPRGQPTIIESEIEIANREQEEIERLRREAAALSAQISPFSQLQAENQKLRAQLAAPPNASFTPEEQEAMEKARVRAMLIRCVNNLKQAGLAARTWELDHPDTYPSDIIAMTNELSTPVILYCPADTGRQSATNWAVYTTANCSYEYLAPNGSSKEPSRILFRCPIHGNLGMCDGTVLLEAAKNHPDWIVQREGKLYYEAPQSKLH